MINIETTDVEVLNADEGFAVLNARDGQDRPLTRFEGPRDTFRLRLQHYVAGDVSTRRVRTTVRATSVTPPTPRLSAGVIVGGALALESGAQTLRLRPRDVFMYPTGYQYLCRWADAAGLFVDLPLDLVHRVAAQNGQRRAVSFHSLLPKSEVESAQWRLAVTHFFAAVSGPQSLVENALVHEHWKSLLAATALNVFPNSASDCLKRVPRTPPTPASLRRAIAFMETHANIPITMVEVAEAARVTDRALQIAFRRHYNLTPREYLRRLRLDCGHRELVAADADCDIRIREVAARWGFTNPSRFAAYYRDQFGVSPRQALLS